MLEKVLRSPGDPSQGELPALDEIVQATQGMGIETRRDAMSEDIETGEDDASSSEASDGAQSDADC